MLFFKFFEAYQNHRHRPQLHFRTHYLLMAHIGHLFFVKIGNFSFLPLISCNLNIFARKLSVNYLA